MTSTRFCEHCGNALSPTARFCPDCGVAVGASSGAGRREESGGRLSRSLSWLIPTAALVAVLIYAITSSTTEGPADPAGAVGGMGGSAPDISTLSADERVDRLFNRVMAAAEAGKMDSVAFFAPMAVSSFDALRPLSPHRRYDLGLVYLVSGDHALARAESDSILDAEPSHLLGLALGMRAAAAANDASAQQRLGKRFLDRLATERARNLPEYVDHAGEIDAALAQIEGRAKPVPAGQVPR